MGIILYVIIILGAVALFLLWWFFGGRKEKFEGPTILYSLQEFPVNDIVAAKKRVSLDEVVIEIPVRKVDDVSRIAAPLATDPEPAAPLIVFPERTTPRVDGYIPPYARRNKKSKGEMATCQALERIYGLPFKSVWPQWLINHETGNRMEIDCYNDDLMIGAEYNGKQHYEFPNFYHKTKDEFEGQLRRDKYKLELCNHYGVFLIPVPYHIPNHQIENHLRNYTPESILMNHYQQPHVV